MATLFALCRIYPGSRWAIVRKDLPTLRRNILPVFQKLKPASFGDFRQDNWEAKHDNGSTILLFPESHAGDKGYDRWKGLEVNGFWMEEANELQESSWHWALQRAGSWVLPPSINKPKPDQPPPYILLTSNPAGNWVKRLFYTPWKKGMLKAPYFYIPATIHDNPHLNPEYLKSLEGLPERDYKVYVEGDWDLLQGQALEELNRDIHIKPFDRKNVPDHWVWFGAFDWGYSHPFSFGLYVAGPETIIKWETITGAKMADAQMVSYIAEVLALLGVSPGELAYVVAGKDAWHDVQARAAIGETTAERFQKAGFPMMPADNSRISGLKNMRELLAWQKTGPEGTPGHPRFVLRDTPANQKAFDQLQGMILDPDRPEDVLKQDATEGEGGDDIYDETRYALQSRAKAGPAPAADVGDDQHPGYDYQEKARKRGPAPEALATGTDDDLRANYRFPQQPFMTRHRMGRFGEGGRPLADEDIDE